MPRHAETPCALYTLPANPTQYDLEVGYSIRGSQVSECDGKRDLAVQTHAREHELEAEAAKLREERNRPWWKVWP
jgi:hypothetical protein